MASQPNCALLERYRQDRRELLKFVISSNVHKLVLPPEVSELNALDLDNINVHHVLHCVQSGASLELSRALMNAETEPVKGDENGDVQAAEQPEVVVAQNGGNEKKCEGPPSYCRQQLTLSLPPFQTGLTEADIRETAYEVLLASIGAAGGLISLSKEKKEERLPRRNSQPIKSSGLASLMDIMRRQMQITEESDKRTRDALLHASAGRLGKRIDGLLLPLELLCRVPKGDDNTYLSWQKRQINIIREGILHNPYWNLQYSDHLAAELRISLSAIQESEVMPSSKVLSRQADALQRVRDVCLAIFERNGKPQDICHWADGYYLNVRMYEKLLLCIFNVDKPNRFVEEVEEVLELLKSTWRILGVTQTIHDISYTWVLFKQFVLTDDFSLLQLSARQMKRIATDRQRSASERAHMRSLRSAVEDTDGLSYVQSVLKPIKSVADEMLNDYHLHFVHDRTRMETMLLLAMTAARILADEEVVVGTDVVPKQAEHYVESSMRQAYARVVQSVDESLQEKSDHRLVRLAEAVTELAKQDASLFSPLFSRWLPLAPAVTASVLHASYYKELKPFLEKISTLPDDQVGSVLPAANLLEQYLLNTIASFEESEALDEYKRRLSPYEVEDISGSRGMQCITKKLADLSQHAEKAPAVESWERELNQGGYGRSAPEFFQLVEKLVEEFFNMELPMKVAHLRVLVTGLDNAIRVYANSILLQLGDKGDLLPPAPMLTRHKRDSSLRAFSKKKVSDPRLPDEKRAAELNSTTTATLCVRLNTLHFVSSQLNQLEDSIKQQWSIKRPQYAIAARKRNPSSKNSEEVFPDFEVSRKAINWAIEQTCVFIGLKVIFWDMRETYVDKLYKGGVTQFRMQKAVGDLDTVLGQLCEFLIGPLRDQVVVKLLEAAVEGFLWVLLDGGPLRSFSQADVSLLEQDLKILKDFFIADGDGLPKPLVDAAASQVQHVLNLYKLDIQAVIDSYRRASGGDSEIVLRVLCHRKDKEAAKFLKHCKLPKG